MKLFLTAIFAILFTTINAQQLIYVKANATGDGSSWQSAADLQTGLDLATEGAQLWVAKGTHLPTESRDRSASVVVDKDIKIYGGCIGSETSISQRDARINKTILSGEIASNKVEDNSYTVITIKGASAAMILDGFTITAGMADGSTQPGTAARCGGAIFNDGQSVSSNPIIRNCIFKDNIAREGGAVYNLGLNGESSPKLLNCTFKSNQADLDGGAIYNNAANGNSNPILVNCIFKDNVAGYGAGIYSNTKGGDSKLDLNGCIFQDNMAYMWGGGIFGNEKSGFEVAMDDCSFANNYPTDINKEITVGQVDTSKSRGAK
jgi:predicted outer membrane repeat protein